jgi:intracellular septation protein A
MPEHMTVHLPAPLALLRRGAQHLLESTLVPLGLFYLVFTITGLKGALFAALGWSLLALARRVVLRKDIPAVLLLTTGLLCVRTLVGYLTGSVFLYFLQPTVQNFVFAAVLLLTLPLDRPLLAKLADDFCAFPTIITAHPHVRRFFRRVSLLWALVFITNGVTTLWALASATVGNFLMVSTAGSYSVVALAAGVSLIWFRRSLRAHGITLRLGGHKTAAP